MKARIVRIGNSKGIGIPKLLIEQTGLTDEVTIEAEGNRLVIRAAREPRADGTRRSRRWRRRLMMDCSTVRRRPPRSTGVNGSGGGECFEVYLVSVDPTIGSRDPQDATLPHRLT